MWPAIAWLSELLGDVDMMWTTYVGCVTYETRRVCARSGGQRHMHGRRTKVVVASASSAPDEDVGNGEQAPGAACEAGGEERGVSVEAVDVESPAAAQLRVTWL